MLRRALALPCLLAGSIALAACSGSTTAAPATGAAGSASAGQATLAAAASQANTPPSADPGTPSSAPATAPASGPIDACALLTAAEVTPLVPAPVTTAAGPDGGPIASYSCTWDDGTGSNQIPPSLSVKVWPDYVTGTTQVSGMSADMVKQIATGAAVNDGGAVIDGLGDLGVVDPVSHFGPEVTFFKGNAMVQLDYTADNGLSKQDAVVAVARLVAGRLP